MNYWGRRLLLLPLTLIAIAVVNFAIINLAPGEPTTTTDVTEQGEATRRAQGAAGLADPYFQFREEFGLNLPILLNTWPWTSQQWLEHHLEQLVADPAGTASLRRDLGDRARYTMKPLLAIAKNEQLELRMRAEAVRLLVRGALRVGNTGAVLTAQERAANDLIAANNSKLEELVWSPKETQQVNESKLLQMEQMLAAGGWLQESRSLGVALSQTRLSRYFSKVARLDFGTLRTNPSRRVVDEVASRLKYSLTLAVLPLILSFGLALCLGVAMAFHHKRSLDWGLGLISLLLYAVPVFIVAPLLLDLVPLHAPTGELVSGGLTSSAEQYERLTSFGRLQDIGAHVVLPLAALVYLPMAVQTRLCRTSMLEVMRQDYIRAARAKGVSAWRLCWSHVVPNGAIALLTAVGGALGALLGGSLIVESVFNLNGFGQFFLHAVVQRDYNVILFSVLASSTLALTGYLLADIACARLDPRYRLAEAQL
jgi:peptide/nickel transport system permease protein